MYTYVHLFQYTYIDIYIYIHIYIYTYTQMYICTYIHIYIYTYMYVAQARAQEAQEFAEMANQGTQSASLLVNEAMTQKH